MSSEIEERVERLESKLMVTRAVAAILFLALTIALVLRTKESDIRPALRVTDGRREVQVFPHAVNVGNTSLDMRGLSAHAFTKAEMISQVKDVGADLQASPYGAHSYIGIAGAVGFTESVRDGSTVVRLTAYGRVHSEIQIDTETGAWTLVRSVGDPKSNPTETTQLIGPLSTK